MKTILFIIFLCSVAIESIALPKEGDSKEMDTFPKAEKRVKNLKKHEKKDLQLKILRAILK